METSGRACPAGIDSFDNAQLPATLMRNLQLCGFNKPTPVQKYSIPIGLADRDMMACAQTGSGKVRRAVCAKLTSPTHRRAGSSFPF